jgi:hypothetical protein
LPATRITKPSVAANRAPFRVAKYPTGRLRRGASRRDPDVALEVQQARLRCLLALLSDHAAVFQDAISPTAPLRSAIRQSPEGTASTHVRYAVGAGMDKGSRLAHPQGWCSRHRRCDGGRLRVKPRGPPDAAEACFRAGAVRRWRHPLLKGRSELGWQRTPHDGDRRLQPSGMLSHGRTLRLKRPSAQHIEKVVISQR